MMSPALVFLGRSPPSLILTTCTVAHSPRIHLFLALMRKLGLSSSLLLEACSAASCLVPSSPPVGGRRLCKFLQRQINWVIAVAFPASVLLSFVSLCSQAPTLSFLVLNIEKQKKVPLWRLHLHGAAWLSDLTGKAPLFRQKKVWHAHTRRNLLHSLQAHLAAVWKKGWM